MSFYLSKFDEKIIWNKSIYFSVKKLSEECINKSINQNGGTRLEATDIKWNFITKLSINNVFENSAVSTIALKDNNVKISFSKIDFNPNDDEELSIISSLEKYKKSLEINCN
ncbi:hypothetical protein ABE501_00870 [Comamonas testosteroni]